MDGRMGAAATRGQRHRHADRRQREMPSRESDRRRPGVGWPRMTRQRQLARHCTSLQQQPLALDGAVTAQLVARPPFLCVVAAFDLTAGAIMYGVRSTCLERVLCLDARDSRLTGWVRSQPRPSQGERRGREREREVESARRSSRRRRAHSMSDRSQSAGHPPISRCARLAAASGEAIRTCLVLRAEAPGLIAGRRPQHPGCRSTVR